jgi:hypothetical protein
VLAVVATAQDNSRLKKRLGNQQNRNKKPIFSVVAKKQAELTVLRQNIA